MHVVSVDERSFKGGSYYKPSLWIVVHHDLLNLEDCIVLWRPSGEIGVSVTICNCQLERFAGIQKLDVHPIVP